MPGTPLGEGVPECPVCLCPAWVVRGRAKVFAARKNYAARQVSSCHSYLYLRLRPAHSPLFFSNATRCSKPFAWIACNLLSRFPRCAHVSGGRIVACIWRSCVCFKIMFVQKICGLSACVWVRNGPEARLLPNFCTLCKILVFGQRMRKCSLGLST